MIRVPRSVTREKPQLAEMIEGLARSLRRRLSLRKVSSTSSYRNTGHGTQATKQAPEVTH